MDTVTLLRDQLKQAHELLENTMADVTAEQAQWLPPGVATPLGASYAHAVLAEDAIINGVLQGGAPLLAGAWAGRQGLSEPSPGFFGSEWSGYPAWTRRVQVDLPALRAYAQAVYAASDAYLAGLQPADLERELSLPDMEHATLAWALSMMVIAHANNLCGEISCLKGLQGAKGYPF
jgi:hypothetical protein